jgi:acyl-CoA synthetase (AMP-forming)/AMP-acid ligase II
VARLAAGLQALGVRRGDRIAILALNSDRYTEFLSAVWWAGAVVVPMNIRWTAAENAYSLKDCGARILFVDRAFAAGAAEMTQACPTLQHVVWCDDGPAPDGHPSHDDLIAAHAPAPDVLSGGEDLAGLYYTGGTTGFPKGVQIPHRALWFNNLLAAKLLEVEPDDVVLHAAPMFHMADSCLGGAASVMGAAHTYVPRFEPDAVMAAIETYAVTHTVIVPTMIAMLLQHPAFTTERLRSLRVIGYGGSSISRGVLTEALAKLPHVRFVQVYGQTEMAPIISSLPPKDHVVEGPDSRRLAAAGRPAPGCEVRIVDGAGADVLPGEVGEIIARGPGMMHGYWNLPEQTAAAIREGWVHTGDGGYRDADGYIFIVDRVKDMIVSGGENVFSAEVESAVSTHPGVAQVAVIGIPSDQWGEAVHAIVVPRPGFAPSDSEIMAHCEPLLANYKRPRSVTIRAEALPLSGAGKILKRELRVPFWEGRERSIN